MGCCCCVYGSALCTMSQCRMRTPSADLRFSEWGRTSDFESEARCHVFHLLLPSTCSSSWISDVSNLIYPLTSCLSRLALHQYVGPRFGKIMTMITGHRHSEAKIQATDQVIVVSHRQPQVLLYCVWLLPNSLSKNHESCTVEWVECLHLGLCQHLLYVSKALLCTHIVSHTTKKSGKRSSKCCNAGPLQRRQASLKRNKLDFCMCLCMPHFCICTVYAATSKQILQRRPVSGRLWRFWVGPWRTEAVCEDPWDASVVLETTAEDGRTLVDITARCPERCQRESHFLFKNSLLAA